MKEKVEADNPLQSQYAHINWTEKAYPKLIHYNRLPKGGATSRRGNSRNCLLKRCE